MSFRPFSLGDTLLLQRLRNYATPLQIESIPLESVSPARTVIRSWYRNRSFARKKTGSPPASPTYVLPCADRVLLARNILQWGRHSVQQRSPARKTVQDFAPGSPRPAPAPGSLVVPTACAMYSAAERAARNRDPVRARFSDSIAAGSPSASRHQA